MEASADNAERVQVISPIDGELVETLLAASAAEVAASVAKAVTAQRAWSGLAPERRGEILWTFGTLVEREAAAIGLLDTRSTGKVLKDSVAEARRGARHARYWAGMADKLYGQQLADVSGRLSYTRREPLGAYVVVLPWNAPAHSFMARVMPPLACGNAVIVKPSELSPLSALLLGELALQAGVPEGVLQVVIGDGRVGAALCSHPEVRGISFTGSPETGKRILRAAADTFKKVTLELGGKSPIVVFPDADLNSAARAVVMGIMFNAGQICAASSRLIVHRDISDGFIADVRARAERVVVGDPHHESTQIGPIVCRRQYDSVMAKIRKGVDQGANVIVGGGRPPGLDASRGLYVAPTILDTGDKELPISKEEIFGPVLTVTRFGTEAEALSLANDSEYGLAAYVWTSNAGRLIRMTDAIEAGAVHGNTTLVMDSGLPFGGFKSSGLGGAFGTDAVDGCTRTKRVTLRVAASGIPELWPGV